MCQGDTGSSGPGLWCLVIRNGVDISPGGALRWAVVAQAPAAGGEEGAGAEQADRAAAARTRSGQVPAGTARASRSRNVRS